MSLTKNDKQSKEMVEIAYFKQVAKYYSISITEVINSVKNLCQKDNEMSLNELESYLQKMIGTIDRPFATLKTVSEANEDETFDCLAMLIADPFIKEISNKKSKNGKNRFINLLVIDENGFPLQVVLLNKKIGNIIQKGNIIRINNAYLHLDSTYGDKIRQRNYYDKVHYIPFSLKSFTNISGLKHFSIDELADFYYKNYKT